MPKAPRSYDDIVRSTVPDPDGSFRPTPKQVGEAGEEFREERALAQMTDSERETYARLATVLLADSDGIGFEVENGRVTLYGTVRDAGEIEALEQRARGVAGVADVTNRLVVAP
ncbi:MAG: BON domain-containing protein [Kofleriaceae bacterium]